MTTTFLFREWPYLALALLVLGLALRYLTMRRRWPPAPFELARAWAYFRGDRLWRASLIILIAAHVVAVCAPRAVLAWDSVPWRLYLLEAAGLLAGVAALVAWGRLIWRHLAHTSSSIAAEIADSIFLSFLFVALLSGVLTAIAYRWASSWSAATLTPYAVSLIYGAPAAGLVAKLPFLVRIHLVSSFAALATLPFTRLAPFPILAVQRLLTAAVAPAAIVARRGAARLRARDRLTWLWPEREYRWADGDAEGDGSSAERPQNGARARRRRHDEADALPYQSGPKA